MPVTKDAVDALKGLKSDHNLVILVSIVNNLTIVLSEAVYAPTKTTTPER